MVEYRKGFSLDELKNLICYDPSFGKFTWLINRRGYAKIGDIAGSYNFGGYIVIKIYGCQYQASQLAWFYMTGEWPEDEIDHEDGITDNNKWNNLRKAAHIQNAKNRKLNINNTTGFKGVHKRGNKYRSKINFNGIQISLGTFDTMEDAKSAYDKAADFYYGQFIRKDACHGRV